MPWKGIIHTAGRYARRDSRRTVPERPATRTASSLNGCARGCAIGVFALWFPISFWFSYGMARDALTGWTFESTTHYSGWQLSEIPDTYEESLTERIRQFGDKPRELRVNGTLQVERMLTTQERVFWMASAFCCAGVGAMVSVGGLKAVAKKTKAE